MTSNMSVIGGLKIRRESLGWSLAKLAGRCGIDETFLGDWEHGLGSPRFDELQDWAAALGLGFELVLTQSESRCRVEIEWDKRCVKVDGAAIRLAPMEWKALERLARTPGELVTRKQLFHHIYGDNRRYEAQSTAIRVLITKLRRLLPVRIEARWGQGYVISGLPSSPAHARNGAAAAEANIAPRPRVMHTPSEPVRPIPKLPPRDPPRLQPVDRAILGNHRAAAAPIKVGRRRVEELGVIERFLAERGVTRCPDIATIQHSPLPALTWDKAKRKWVRASVAALQPS
jgi:transcriptional regulator with XRE-family HTH domain